MYFEPARMRAKLQTLYSGAELSAQIARTEQALQRFSELYDPSGTRSVHVFSVPGRSELSGNHTDHNRGCVLAATVSLDMLAVVSRRSDGTIRLTSEGMDEIRTDIGSAPPDPALFGTSLSLIRGLCAGFWERGIELSGFDAYLNGLKYTGALAEREGNVITGKGPGAVFAFAGKIAEAAGLGAKLPELFNGMFVKF